MARASVISPYQRFWDGVMPVSGGTVTFYNGANLAPVFADPDFKIPQTNPYRLDASGRIIGDLRFPGILSVVVKDSSGTTVDTIPDVSCFDPASIFGEWSATVAYGQGGQNIVTASDGEYYVSRVDDNLNNDPTVSPREWELVQFFELTAAQVARLAQISRLSPASQAIIAGTGSVWNATQLATIERDYLSGLSTANGTDADHDINIASGRCNDSTNALSLNLASAFVKRIDATWAAGTGNGGLASGASLGNNTTYHLFVVSVGGAIDVMFDSSLICANGVANNAVTHYRRIASVVTNSSANIRAYFQYGDYFFWNIPVQDISVTPPGNDPVEAALTLPSGFAVTAIIKADVIVGAVGSIIYGLITSPDQTDTAPSATAYNLLVQVQAADESFSSMLQVFTDDAAQIRYHMDGSPPQLNVSTFGWIDTRA